MLPVGDDAHPGGPPPVVTYALVAANVLAFFFEIARPSPEALQAFVQAWGVVPREYTEATDFAPQIPLPIWSTLVTSMFLHGGWMHLGGNMLYLWIFGDNIEKVMGHARFALFYLVTGTAAGLAHIFFNATSMIPTVGASGAISGVLGGYLLLFPKNRVRVLTRGGIMHVPAFVVLGFWILIQFINHIGTVARTPETAGVAYLAHIGGFVAGLALAPVLAAGRRPERLV